jgi:hypothetical protein
MVAVGRIRFPDDVDELGGGHIIFLGQEGETQYDQPRGVNLGDFFDVVVSEHAHMGGGWNLRFNTRVRDPSEVWELGVEMRYNRRLVTLPEVEALLSDSEDHAVLWLPGGDLPGSQNRLGEGETGPWNIRSNGGDAAPMVTGFDDNGRYALWEKEKREIDVQSAPVSRNRYNESRSTHDVVSDPMSDFELQHLTNSL